jgi:ABC-type transporter Mla subunit MlaD
MSTAMGEALDALLTKLRALEPQADRLENIDGAIDGARKELAMVNAMLAKARGDLIAVEAERGRVFDQISTAKAEIAVVLAGLGEAHKQYDALQGGTGNRLGRDEDGKGGE